MGCSQPLQCGRAEIRFLLTSRAIGVTVMQSCGAFSAQAEVGEIAAAADQIYAEGVA